MAFTRMAVSIGIVCSVWMASPLTANAQYEKFVGLSDKGKTKVKTCDDNGGGSQSFANNFFKHNIALNIDLANEDGMNGGDNFDAFFTFIDPPATVTTVTLFSGVWSKTKDRSGKQTYQLTPSGDLTTLAASGWEELLMLINGEAGDACLSDPQGNVYEALSDLVKGTLDVNTKKPIECPVDEVGQCWKAKVSLVVKAFMDFEDDDHWGDAKVDLVQFKYKAKGYVVSLSP